MATSKLATNFILVPLPNAPRSWAWRENAAKIGSSAATPDRAPAGGEELAADRPAQEAEPDEPARIVSIWFAHSCSDLGLSRCNASTRGRHPEPSAPHWRAGTGVILAHRCPPDCQKAGAAMSVTLAPASTIVEVALKKGRETNCAPLTVAVLDAGGHLVAFKREDRSGILRPDIAMAKAWGALGMGFGTSNAWRVGEPRL